MAVTALGLDWSLEEVEDNLALFSVMYMLFSYSVYRQLCLLTDKHWGLLSWYIKITASWRHSVTKLRRSGKTIEMRDEEQKEFE